MTVAACAMAAASAIPTGALVRLGRKVFIRSGDEVLEVTVEVSGGTRTVADIAPAATNTAGGIPLTTAQTQSLRGNMQRDGMRFDPGEEAHHIVARNDPRAAEARNLLAEAGVDVNSPAHGVPLPGTRTTPNPSNKAVYRGDVIHSQGYYDYVNSELRNVPAPQRTGVIRCIADELERGEINW